MRKYGFQGKMFVTYSIFMILIILLTFTLFYFYQSRWLENRAAENLHQLSIKSAQQMDEFFREMDKMALQIFLNPQLQEVMITAREDSKTSNYFLSNVMLSRELRGILASINGPEITAARISLYNDKMDYISMGLLNESQEKVQERLSSRDFQNWYEDMLVYQGKRVISMPHEDYWSENSLFMISLYREFRNVYDSYGMIEVQQPFEQLEQRLELQSLTDTYTILLDQEGEIVYSNTPHQVDPSLLLKQVGTHQENEIPSFNIYPEEAEDGMLVTYHPSEMTNWTLFILQEEDVFLQPIRSLSQLLLILSIGFIGIILIGIFFVTRQLTKPLKKLRHSLQKVNLKNLQIDFTDESTANELILLNRAFNKTFDRLKQSMELEIQAKNQEAEARFHALQSQMNPHFLYNVLAVISAAGQQAGVYKVMDLCHKLSSMLRYITSYQSKVVTIEDEVQYACKYLELMKDRYEDAFEYTVTMDETVANVKVPRLVLQPLLENCFEHAFREVDPTWRIWVTIKEVEGKWQIRVADNGCGMEEKQVHALFTKLDKGLDEASNGFYDVSEGGLGLYNTVLRLKLQYGNDLTFEITENQPTGTMITLEGAMEDDENHDRGR